MVSTRAKKKTANYNKTLEENEAAENALAETLISDSLPVNVEEPNADAQLEDKADISVDEARNENFEGTSEEEESEKVTKVDNGDENTVVREINGDSRVESAENTFEDDEIDDQENVLWEDDEENSEHDNEERVFDEYEFSEDEATEEDNEDDEVSEQEPTEEDDDDDEVSEEEAIEEEDNDEVENTSEEKEIAKGDEREAKAKKDGREADAKAKEEGREPDEHNTKKSEVSLKTIKKSSERSRKKKVQADSLKKVNLRDKPESSRKRKVKKRVESMGMIFMCSSKTKNDCYQYMVLGLPGSKKDLVQKIYTGMRLFLYDVDLKLLYGIYKAAGPGGYNIEPKAFKSQFPSQVRFKVLNDCLPLAEEKFKKVIKDNYYTKTKFDCQLNSEQVKTLCKLFIASSKGRRSKKLGRSRKADKQPVQQERTRRKRAGDKKRLPLREEVQYGERPRKHPRKVMRPEAPLRQLLPAPLPSTVPSSYVYERTPNVDAYRRDPYLERHSPYRDRRDRLLNRHDPYGDRRDPPIERSNYYGDGRDPAVERDDRYRDGRDPYLERHYAYKDGRDPYVERRDPYRDERDTYPRRQHDPYRDGRDSYLELPDPYRDRQDPYIERRDSYRDGRRDSYLDRRVPYRDATRSELYSSYRRDPLSDRRDVYREDGGVEYCDSYRRQKPLERRDLYPSNLGTRQCHDIAGRDSYVSNRERPSYAEPIYPAEYPSRAGMYRL